MHSFYFNTPTQDPPNYAYPHLMTQPLSGKVVINANDYTASQYPPTIQLVCEEVVRFEKEVRVWVNHPYIKDEKQEKITYVPWHNKTTLFSQVFSLSNGPVGHGQFTFPFNFQTPMDGVGSCMMDLGGNKGVRVTWKIAAWCGQATDIANATNCPNFSEQELWVVKAPEAYHQGKKLNLK